MSDIFREVDEDIRREQLKSLWERFGIYVIGAAVLIVVTVAGYRLWEYWQDRQGETRGDQYVEAMAIAADGRLNEAVTAFQSVAEGGGAYGVLASMQAASAKAQAGLTESAAADFNRIAEDPATPELLRDIARIRAALLLVDTASLDQIRGWLEPIATVGSPFRHTAREIIGLSAWRTGDVATAQSSFEQILNDFEAPQTARERARLLLNLIAARTDLATVAAPPPAPPPTPVLPELTLPGLSLPGLTLPTTPTVPPTGPSLFQPTAPPTGPSLFQPTRPADPLFVPSPPATPAPAVPAPAPEAAAPPAAPAPAPEAAPAPTPEAAPAPAPAPAEPAPAPAP